MKFKLRTLVAGAVVALTVFSCARQEMMTYTEAENTTLAAWVQKYAPNAEKYNDNMYIEWIERNTNPGPADSLVEVGDWVVIGGHSAVHQWCKIGDHCMIQGGSLVRQDVPPFVTMRETGSYAGINKLGLQRRGFTPEQLEAIHNAYRIIFQSDLNFTNACNEAEQTLPQSPERDYILEFVRESLGGRGVIKKYGR